MTRTYVPSSGPWNARLAAVGQSPGSDEVAALQPFVGRAGWCLDGMLRDAGIDRRSIFIANVSRFQPPGNKIERFITRSKKSGLQYYNERYVADHIPAHIDTLREELTKVHPNVVLALGEEALWALTGQSGITNWQGSIMECKLVPGLKVIPLLHPAGILRQWEDRFQTVEYLKGRVRSELAYPEIRRPRTDFTIRPNLSDVLHFFDHWFNTPSEFCTMDIETILSQYISCIGFATNAERAICIPFIRGDGSPYWSFEEEIRVVNEIRLATTHQGWRGVGQNWQYDETFIWLWWGFFANLWRDTSITHHTMFPGLPKNLNFLRSLYCDFHEYWKDERKDWRTKEVYDENRFWTYNCTDCVVTHEVMSRLLEVERTFGMQSQVAFQHRRVDLARKPNIRGFRIDKKARSDLRATTGTEEIEQFFINALGHPLNPRSNHATSGQIPQLIYGDFGVAPVLSRKTKRPTLDAKALPIIAKREPLLKPIVEGIEDYRSLRLFRSNFLDAPLDPDGRMRCQLGAGGTETFRFSATKNPRGGGANMQTIPAGSSSVLAQYLKDHGGYADYEALTEHFEMTPAKLHEVLDLAERDGTIRIGSAGASYRKQLPNVRKIFVPDTGYVLMDWDLQRADLQVVAWESGDETLKQKLREGIDIHTDHAKLLGVSRYKAKIWTHLTDYAGSPRTAAITIGVTQNKGEQMRNRYFGEYPGIPRWHNRTEADLARQRYVENIYGYRRYYFDTRNLREVLKQALAWKPQSTVALVIDQGWDNLDRHMSEVEVLLQNHDSLVMQVQQNLFPACVPTIHQHLLIEVPYPDPLVIGVGCKWSEKSWGDVQVYKEGAVNPRDKGA